MGLVYRDSIGKYQFIKLIYLIGYDPAVKIHGQYAFLEVNIPYNSNIAVEYILFVVVAYLHHLMRSTTQRKYSTVSPVICYASIKSSSKSALIREPFSIRNRFW